MIAKERNSVASRETSYTLALPRTHTFSFISFLALLQAKVAYYKATRKEAHGRDNAGCTHCGNWLPTNHGSIEKKRNLKIFFYFRMLASLEKTPQLATDSLFRPQRSLLQSLHFSPFLSDFPLKGNLFSLRHCLEEKCYFVVGKSSSCIMIGAGHEMHFHKTGHKFCISRKHLERKCIFCVTFF